MAIKWIRNPLISVDANIRLNVPAQSGRLVIYDDTGHILFDANTRNMQALALERVLGTTTYCPLDQMLDDAAFVDVQHIPEERLENIVEIGVDLGAGIFCL